MVDTKKALKLRKSGLTWQEVGMELGLSGEAIRSQVRRSSPQPLENGTPQAVDSQRVKELENLVETLTAKLGKARKPRKITAPKAPKSSKGSFIRVVIPDLHGCFHDPAAVGAMLHDIKALNPREVIILGDILDCGGFLAEHHTWGYVAESDYCYEDDISAANMLLDQIQAAAPNAKYYLLEGNHERRVESWCLTAITRSKKAGANAEKDARRLLQVLAPENVLHLQERGIEWFKQGQFYHGCRIRATIKLGECYFTHGTRCGANSARATLSDFGANVVYGHTHHIQQASINSVRHGSMAAWNIGCLCELQPLYGHDRKTQWNHGYAVQFVNPSGRFQHVTVHIVEGESMLIPLTQMVN